MSPIITFFSVLLNFSLMIGIGFIILKKYKKYSIPKFSQSEILSAKYIADIIDTLLSCFFAIHAKSNNLDKYKIKDEHMNKLIKVLSTVVKKYNFDAENSSLFDAALILIALYTPIYYEANTDMKFSKMKSEIDNLENKINVQSTKL